MQFIVTFFWSFLLISLLNYVVSSVNAVPFDFALGAIVSVVFAVMLFIMSMILPEEPVPDYE
ncbi:MULTISPECIES: YjzD family protein [Bhargavaea]|uniref:YjzD family protein n=1 Tax=Bhargavaea changchunensis TaxID=2134037 RepID=A0ABW2NHD4_9BACL|nr:YjzD family protein [Bhargavaea sp. CC-171006]